MIPKIIHYFWCSEGEIPEEVNNCIESWKKYLPNYEIRQWNSNNFDFSCCNYVKQAYEAQKYAFVSDYVRLAVLYKYGGVYFDTDVEVISSFDEFLNQEAFCGFESEGRLGTCVLGSVPNNIIIKKFLDHYNNLQFIKDNGEFDLTPNPVPITNICIENGMKPDDTIQYLHSITIYPRTYFCPINPFSKGDFYSVNTVSVHHFSGAWLDNKMQNRIKLKKKMIKRLGISLGGNLHSFLFMLVDEGLTVTLTKILEKIKRS